MEIDVVGGGPGGLYTSLLIKKLYPDWDLTVYEQNPPEETYGWGIVFSDSTLSSLREADYDTHEAITDAFVRWDPLNVYHEGQRFSCDGNAFAAMMRHELLDILRSECERRDVDLRYEARIDDPTELAADADALIGADGLNSIVREAYSEQFQPRIREGSVRFAWYGTEKPFDAFTFVFRENEDGLWQIHCYPGEKSTVVVECNEETWENAGFDQMADEGETLAYLEDVIGEHLGEYELLSKEQRWRTFELVKNRNWTHENVAIIGDAAHTVHYTIGAGTRMAMLDAIAVAQGFDKFGTDAAAALDWYERDRRQTVEIMQDASRWSQDWFENVPKFHDMEPAQFAFHLMTRSTITYDNLKIRDGEYVEAYERWFERNHGTADAERPLCVATPPLFKPFQLREVTFPNRVVRTPGMQFSATDGQPSETHLDRVREQGQSRVGLVMTDPLAVSARGRISPASAGLYDGAHRDAWADVVDDVHADGDAAVGTTLVHAGRRGATHPRTYGLDRALPDADAWPLLAPSPIPYTDDSQVPEPMDETDMEGVTDRFVAAAERADEAGFDLLQLHAGHGYLLSSFLSPLTNERDDDYGGSLDGRMRYPLEVFDAVRDVWPDEKPLAVALQATDRAPGGYRLAEAYEVAEALQARGCDLASVVAGQTTENERASYDTYALRKYCDWIRNVVEVPTMSTTYATSTDEVNTLVGSGRADLCHLY